MVAPAEGDSALAPGAALNAVELAGGDRLHGELPAWVLNLSVGRERGVWSVDGAVLSPEVEAMSLSAMPEGFTRSGTPLQPEIRNIRLGKDALPMDRPNPLTSQPSATSYKSWRVGQGANANGGVNIQLDDDPCSDPTLIIPPPECDPDYGNPPPTNPPPGDSIPGPPGSEPWYFQGGSFVRPWGFGDYVDFASFTSASKDLSYLSVTGYSFIDGWPVASGHDWASPGRMAGVGWTYEAWWFGYGRTYMQLGDHTVIYEALGGHEQFDWSSGDIYYSSAW